MKKYETPEIEEIKVQIKDVIAESGYGFQNDFDSENDWGVPGGDF